MVLGPPERSDGKAKNSSSERTRRCAVATAIEATARLSVGDGILRAGKPNGGSTRRHFTGLTAFAATAWLALFSRSTSAAFVSDQLTLGEWEAIWTRVLERHVDEAGRIDFTGLKGDGEDLERVVAFIAA